MAWANCSYKKRHAPNLPWHIVFAEAKEEALLASMHLWFPKSISLAPPFILIYLHINVSPRTILAIIKPIKPTKRRYFPYSSNAFCANYEQKRRVLHHLASLDCCPCVFLGPCFCQLSNLFHVIQRPFVLLKKCRFH